MEKWIDFDHVKNTWMKNKDFRKEYDALELEYQIALELINARSMAGLTQHEVANRMGTTQSVVARLESGNVLPSVKTLNKYALATGKHLEFHLS